MIQLIPSSQAIIHEQTLKRIYHDSFPPDERREWKDLMELTNTSQFNLYCINKDNTPVGLITYWQWTEFTFIEHFAIDKQLQGKGIGSAVLSLLIKETSVKFILETEEPHTESAKQRIAFYIRTGFHLCLEEYYQPAYSKDQKAVKMLLMSYPDIITHTEFIAIRAKLYKEVYCENVKGFS